MVGYLNVVYMNYYYYYYYVDCFFVVIHYDVNSNYRSQTVPPNHNQNEEVQQNHPMKNGPNLSQYGSRGEEDHNNNNNMNRNDENDVWFLLSNMCTFLVSNDGSFCSGFVFSSFVCLFSSF